MKKSILISIPFFLSLFSFAQIQFEQNTITEQLFRYAYDVCAFDMDMDSDLDLLIADSWNDRIIWYENMGNGNFQSLHVLIENLNSTQQIKACDFDGDGYLDFVTTLGYSILWFRNNGNGTFTQHNVDTAINVSTSIHCSDLDNDNDMDVVSNAAYGNEIVFYLNDGFGNFGVKQVISTAVDIPAGVFAADLDEDELKDVISVSIFDHKIAWYKNLGNGVFGSQVIISQQVFTPVSVSVADLNGDGDEDIIVGADYSGTSNGKVVWFENDGLGSFGTQHTLISNFLPYKLTAIDIDDDGDNDIITSAEIFMNIGSGNFNAPVLIDSIGWRTACADFDNDNDIDIACIFNSCNLAWYANDGVGNFGDRNLVVDGIKSPTKIVYADMDGDSLNDVVVGSNDKYINVCWFKNLGSGDYTKADTICHGYQYIRELDIVDMDGDGIPDLFSRYSDDTSIKIGWMKQDSVGEFSPMQLIRDSAIGVTHLSDLDLDGDMDILFGPFENNNTSNPALLSILENDGNGNFGNELVLRQGLTSPAQIETHDFNNDGALDILYADNRITIGINQGSLNNFYYSFAGSQTYGTDVFKVADMDGDNDLDIVYACTYNPSLGDHLGWLKNDGTGTFTTIPLSYTASYTKKIVLKDIDLDGDIDIIGGRASQNNSMYWFENDGTGSFIPGQNGLINLITDSISVQAIVVDDMDYDGDNDVLYTGGNMGLIGWFENVGKHSNDSASSCANVPYQLGNQILTSPGTYIDSLQTVFGLDSIVELEFSHIPIP